MTREIPAKKGIDNAGSEPNPARLNYSTTYLNDTENEVPFRPSDAGRSLASTKQTFVARNSKPASSRKRAARYHFFKRSLDITVCIAVLPVALPILAVTALSVRLTSPGPVLFVQERTGRGGRPFSILKIRTMVVDAERQKAVLKKQSAIDGPDFKLIDDPRVTRVGAFLRKTSLDELPQLWNVLKGDMSLVGPRPTSFGIDAYEHWHTARRAGAAGYFLCAAAQFLNGPVNTVADYT